MRSIRESGVAQRALLALSMLCLGLPPAAAQDTWTPSKSIEIIVASGPGGAADREARVMQSFLQKQPGMPVVNVINRPGGGGTVAWSTVMQRPGDGHTLSTLSVAAITNKILGNSEISYRDLTPLAILMHEYIAVWTREASTIQSGKDLVGRLRKDPASVSFGLSSALGNQNHIVIGMIAKAAGIDPRSAKVVVYSSGGKGIPAALGGHVEVWAGTLGGAVGLARKGGPIRMLGVSSAQSAPGPAAAFPTFRDQGIDVVHSAYRGLQGPPGLSAAQRAFWDKTFSAIVKSEEWTKTVEKYAWGGGYLDSAATKKYLDEEYVRLENILGELGVIK
jgi:putative tricarboxylic transport membrane protein